MERKQIPICVSLRNGYALLNSGSCYGIVYSRLRHWKTVWRRYLRSSEEQTDFERLSCVVEAQMDFVLLGFGRRLVWLDGGDQMLPSPTTVLRVSGRNRRTIKYATPAAIHKNQNIDLHPKVPTKLPPTTGAMAGASEEPPSFWSFRYIPNHPRAQFGHLPRWISVPKE